MRRAASEFRVAPAVVSPFLCNNGMTPPLASGSYGRRRPSSFHRQDRLLSVASRKGGPVMRSRFGRLTLGSVLGAGALAAALWAGVSAGTNRAAAARNRGRPGRSGSRRRPSTASTGCSSASSRWRRTSRPTPTSRTSATAIRRSTAARRTCRPATGSTSPPTGTSGATCRRCSGRSATGGRSRRPASRTPTWPATSSPPGRPPARTISRNGSCSNMKT